MSIENLSDDIYTSCSELQEDLNKAIYLAETISMNLRATRYSKNIDEDYKLAWETNSYSKHDLRDLLELLKELEDRTSGTGSGWNKKTFRI